MIDGTNHYPAGLDSQYTRMHVGVSWPAARSGYAVVVGQARARAVRGSFVLEVLDEGIEGRLYEFVRRVAMLHQYYHPERILADGDHVAGMQFAAECHLRIEPALLCAMPQPLAYALPLIARGLDTDRIVLPAASRLRGELLTTPAHVDPATLKLDEYPGVAALAYAVLSLDSTSLQPRRQARAKTTRRI
jgi:hypothetical protein